MAKANNGGDSGSTDHWLATLFVAVCILAALWLLTGGF